MKRFRSGAWLQALLGLLFVLEGGVLHADGELLVMEALRRGVLLSTAWVFLAVGLLLVALTLRRTVLWLAALRRIETTPRRSFNLQLRVLGPSGHLGVHNFDYVPVVVAAGGSADLLLPCVSDPRIRFMIDRSQGRVELVSDIPLMINGVSGRRKLLKEGDCIKFGPYRLEFTDASILEHPVPLPDKPVFAWRFPIVALLLGLALLFRQAVPDDRMLLARAVELRGAVRSKADEDARKLSGLLHVLVRREQAEAIPAGPASPVAAAPAAPAAPPVPRVAEPQSPIINATVAAAGGSQRERSGQAEPDRGAASEAGPRILPSEPATPLKQRPAAQQPPAAARQRPPQNPPPAAPAPAGPGVGVFAAEAEASVPPPASGGLEGPAPRGADTADSAHQRIEPPQVLQASVLGSALPATVRKGGIDPLEGLEIRTGTLDLAVQPAARARSAPEVGRVDVRVVAPGRPVEYFKADVLFIHAHPDDESIDFATLMAKASRSGKRTATLLFTDGESGLDLYPQRMVGDIYPARKLEGASLSQVRVVEATRALSILGSEMYVRWGLENRPYNTRRDEVPPAEVIRGWGGEEQLVERLIAVLEGFRPTIVVSPDGPSRAHEHFEHEAVGQLVYGALERLRRSGKSFVKAYLVSVDPYQAGRYEGLTALDAGSRESGSELDYKAIQTLALKEHVTQRDASVIGVSRLSHLSQEFYKVVFWELDESLEEYLK